MMRVTKSANGVSMEQYESLLVPGEIGEYFNSAHIHVMSSCSSMTKNAGEKFLVSNV